MAPSSTSNPEAMPHQGDPTAAAARVGGWHRWIEWLPRMGFVIRGAIYFIPGVLALGWALGRHRRPMSQASAIDAIGQQPTGDLLLVVVAVGLAGYSIWGMARAVFDPLRRGHSPVGIALRVGYAASAIAYLGLLIATLRYLAGGLSQVEQHQDWTAGLLAHPFGDVVVVAVGLCWIFGSGITQIVVGWRHGFERDLAVERMVPGERRWALGLGRVGVVARGMVFTIIGVLLVSAVLHPRAHSGVGLEGALVELAHQPFGRVLLGTAGLGLMAFGTYSAMCARWMRLHGAPGIPGSSSSIVSSSNTST